MKTNDTITNVERT